MSDVEIDSVDNIIVKVNENRSPRKRAKTVFDKNGKTFLDMDSPSASHESASITWIAELKTLDKEHKDGDITQEYIFTGNVWIRDCYKIVSLDFNSTSDYFYVDKTEVEDDDDRDYTTISHRIEKLDVLIGELQKFRNTMCEALLHTDGICLQHDDTELDHY